jgi:glycerophosphoryl diester phosphodiesterase
VKGKLDEAGKLKDTNGDGKVDLRDASTQDPTSLIEDAHKLGLFVHAFTFTTRAGILPAATRETLVPSIGSSSGWGWMGYSANFPTPRSPPADHRPHCLCRNAARPGMAASAGR